MVQSDVTACAPREKLARVVRRFIRFSECSVKLSAPNFPMCHPMDALARIFLYIPIPRVEGLHIKLPKAQIAEKIRLQSPPGSGKMLATDATELFLFLR